MPKFLIDLINADLPELPCWIKPAVLPKRGTWLLGGKPGTFKSYILLELARALSTGTRPFNCPWIESDQPCRVLLIDPEIGEAGLQKRAKSIFARHQPSSYARNVTYLSKDASWKLDTKEGRKFIKDELDAFRPNVLMLDSISLMHSWDEDSKQDMTLFFNIIDGLKQAYIKEDLSVIIAHHFRKGGGEGYDPSSMDNFRGSSMFSQHPDTVMTVERLDKGKSPIVHLNWQKVRHGETPPITALKIQPGEKDNQVAYECCIGGVPPQVALKL